MLPVSESQETIREPGLSWGKVGRRREDLFIQPRTRLSVSTSVSPSGCAFPEGEALSFRTHAMWLALSRSSANVPGVNLTEGQAPRGARAKRLPGRVLMCAFRKQRSPSVRACEAPSPCRPLGCGWRTCISLQ